MPNWCHNKLTVSGPADVLARFVGAAKQPDHGQEVEVEDHEYDTDTQSMVKVTKTVRINQPFDFNQIVAMPEEIQKSSGRFASRTDEERAEDEYLVGKYGAKNWYDWSLINWGTKWNANFGSVFMALTAEGAELPDERREIVAGGEAFYAFDTAWSPPTSVIEAAGKLYPELKFVLVWGEPGNEMAGRFTVEGDEVEDKELALDEALTEKEMWF